MMITPKHIAVIMDGNGRWAMQRNVPIRKGHREGAEALRRVLRHCKSKPEIHYLTVYAFSQENWKRPKSEVLDLMDLLRYFFKQEIEDIISEKIRIRFIGDRAALEPDIQQMLASAEARSAAHEGFTLVIALSYGSRQEIAQATKQLVEQVQQGLLRADEISVDHIQNLLSTHDIPDPDLLIRTGGEERLSNFLLWQCAYTELYFSDVLWPDFSANHFDAALEHFAQRERRFGGRKVA